MDLDRPNVLAVVWVLGVMKTSTSNSFLPLYNRREMTRLVNHLLPDNSVHLKTASFILDPESIRYHFFLSETFFYMKLNILSPENIHTYIQIHTICPQNIYVYKYTMSEYILFCETMYTQRWDKLMINTISWCKASFPRWERVREIQKDGIEYYCLWLSGECHDFRITRL